MIKNEYDEIKANLIKKSLEKDKQDLYIPIERRKGNDARLTFINFMCILLWAAVLVIIAIMEKASRSIRAINKSDFLWITSKFWDTELITVALVIAVVCIFICTICIMLNSTRHRRRNDRIKRSLILCEIICFIIGFFLSIKLY